MELRPYQKIDLANLRGAFKRTKRVVFVGPTGYGKTVLFSHIAHNALQKNKRVMVLAHREELLDQISSAMKAFGLSPAIVRQAEPYDVNSSLVVASVWTLINRLRFFPEPDLLVVDECHHATSKTTWGKILNHWPNAARLGVTATPVRLSGEGLDDLFDELVVGPSTQDLIDVKSLTPCRVFAPSTLDLTGVHRRAGDFVVSELEDAIAKSTITGDCVNHYKRLCLGRRAIAFCVSVAHAQRTSDAFRKEGISSESIDGSMDRVERRRILKDFRQGRIQVLTSCDLVSEGFDVPAVEVGILLRPTQSLGLYLQQVGRCLRTFDGKREAIILDHAGNCLRHGLPTDTREWRLEGTKKEKRKAAQESVLGIKICKSCFAVCPPAAGKCEHCGAPFEIKARKIQEVEGDLKEIKEGIEYRGAMAAQASARSLDALVQLGMLRGYRNPRAWAEHVMRGRHRKTRTV